MHEEVVKIPLSQGKFALIDQEDFERVGQYKWSALCPAPNRVKKRWYGVRNEYENGKAVRHFYLHRFIMNAPKGVEVDHKNGDGLDCRKSNLRLATRSQNAANIPRKRTSQSPYKGVRRMNKSNYWYVDITKNGVNKLVYGFSNPEEAAREYDRLALELHGEFANLNFPPE